MPEAALLAALFVGSVAQDPPYVETRFHRVHLRNGNFIDGDVLQQTEKAVTVRLRCGEMTIRRDQVARVEYVKVRSLRKEPRLPEAPKPPVGGKGRLPAPAAGPSPGNAAGGAMPGIRVAPEVRSRVDDVLARLKAAGSAEKYALANRLLSTGPGTAAYLASMLDRFGGEDLAYVEMALKKLKDAGCVPPLGAQLRSARAEVRRAGASILGELKDARAGGDLLEGLSDPDPTVRIEAIDALHRLGDPDLLAAFVGAVADPDAGVSRRAASAAEGVARDHRRAVELERELEELAGRAGGGARAAALALLARAAPQGHSSTFERALADPSPAVRAAAVGGLATRGAEETLLPLVDAETGKVVRVQLAEALGKIRSRRAVEGLLRWMEDGDRDIRSSAASALKAITGKSHALEHADCAECRAKE